VCDEDFAVSYSERHGRPAPAEQIVDSTPALGAAAVQDTAMLARAAGRKLIAFAVRSDRGDAWWRTRGAGGASRY
jgi:hypothetical protein